MYTEYKTTDVHIFQFSGYFKDTNTTHKNIDAYMHGKKMFNVMLIRVYEKYFIL